MRPKRTLIFTVSGLVIVAIAAGAYGVSSRWDSGNTPPPDGVEETHAPSSGGARLTTGQPSPEEGGDHRARVHTVIARPIGGDSSSGGSTTLSHLTGTGTLRPAHQVELAFPVSGIVVEILAGEGQEVGRNEPLVRLDPVPFQAAADQAEARLRFLDARLKRSVDLAEAGALSAEELEADEAERAAVSAQVRAARWNLERSVLRAPFAGIVRDRTFEVGQVIAPGVPGIEFIDVNTLEVEVALPARDLALVDLDQDAAVIPVDHPLSQRPGRISHRPVSGDPRSSTVPILIEIDNRSGELLAGTVVEVAFRRTDRSTDGGSIVPLTALRVRDDGPVVLVYENGRISEVSVETDLIRGENVIIRGIESGTIVVDEAADRIRHGDAVRLASEGR